MNSVLLPCVVTIPINLDIVQESHRRILISVTYIPQFTLVPRFVLSLRALYAQDVQGRRGSDIDTAFGLGLSSDHGAAGSAIVFAAGGQNEEEEQGEDHVEERCVGHGEEIQMEDREMQSVGSGA